MSHWDPALRELKESNNGFYGPTSFIGYLRENDENPDNYRTAAQLSINKISQLSQALRDNDTMVLRLGRASDGPGTQFGLVHVPSQLDDFFVAEEPVDPGDRRVMDYSSDGQDALTLSQSAQDMLKVYRMLPNFSESSLMDFALSTGILSRALNLDVEQIGTAPTTIASSYEFSFEPHPDRSAVFHHNNGQIEIDAIIMTRRNGERILLVIEAKEGSEQTLAKHKLYYPALAAKNSLSAEVDHIVPVFLRAQSGTNGLLYSIYECSEIPTGEKHPPLAGLETIDNHHFEVRIGE